MSSTAARSVRRGLSRGGPPGARPGRSCSPPCRAHGSRRPRSAVTTSTGSPDTARSAAIAAIAVSPSAGACTTWRRGWVGRSSTRDAAPSSTRCTCTSSPASGSTRLPRVSASRAGSSLRAAARRPARRRAAPGRSRHQPSGREPTTFAPSTITCSTRPGLTGPSLPADSRGTALHPVLDAARAVRRSEVRGPSGVSTRPPGRAARACGACPARPPPGSRPRPPRRGRAPPRPPSPRRSS